MARRIAGLIVVSCLVWCPGAFADATPPTNSTAPAITGNTISGETLSVSTGTWSGTDPISYTYQWERCSSSCSPVSGATNSTYTLSSADDNDTIQAIVTATNSAGSAQAASGLVGPVAPSSAEINAALAKVPRPTGLRLRSLMNRGRTGFTFTAPSAGTLVVLWSYIPRGKHRQTTLAKARADFTGNGTKQVTISVTKLGRQALKHVTNLRIISQASFTPAL